MIGSFVKILFLFTRHFYKLLRHLVASNDCCFTDLLQGRVHFFVPCTAVLRSLLLKTCRPCSDMTMLRGIHNVQFRVRHPRHSFSVSLNLQPDCRVNKPGERNVCTGTSSPISAEKKNRVHLDLGELVSQLTRSQRKFVDCGAV